MQTDVFSNNPVVAKAYQLFLQQANGCLDVGGDGDVCQMWLKAGNPIAVCGCQMSTDLRKLAVEFGFCKSEKANSVSPPDTKSLYGLGQLMFQRGMVTSAQLQILRKERVLRDFAMLCLVKGEPKFFANADCPVEFNHGTVNLLEALYFVFKNYSTPQQIASMDEKFSNCLLIPNSNLPYILPTMHLEKTVTNSLERWAEPRSVADLDLTLGFSRCETLALLMLFEMLGTLTMKNRPKERARQTKKPAVDTRQQKAKAVNQIPSKVDKNKANSTASKVDDLLRSNKNISDKSKKFAYEIRKYSELIRTHNPLKILEVALLDDASKVRKSYMKLVRIFHPDRLSGTGLEHLSSECEKIFANIGNAYQTLTDKELHQEFIEALNDPIIKGNMDLADQKNRAAFDIEKSKILFKTGKLDQAIRVGKRALYIFPHEPTVISMIAWAVFVRNSNDMDKIAMAERFCKKAIQLDGDLELAHYALGNILKKRGDLTNSTKHLELAKKLNKDGKDTPNEIRILERSLGR